MYLEIIVAANQNRSRVTRVRTQPSCQYRQTLKKGKKCVHSISVVHNIVVSLLDINQIEAFEIFQCFDGQSTHY